MDIALRFATSPSRPGSTTVSSLKPTPSARVLGCGATAASSSGRARLLPGGV